MRDEQLCRLRRTLGNKADDDICIVLVEDLRDLLAHFDETFDAEQEIADLERQVRGLKDEVEGLEYELAGAAA